MVQKYLKIKEGSLFSYFFSRVNFTPLINVGILNMEVNLVLNKICFVIEGDIWKQEFKKFANIYLLFLNGETDYFNNVFQSYFFHNNRSLEISYYTSVIDNYKTINSLTSHFISNPLKDLVMSFVTSRKEDIVKFMREDGVKEAVIVGKESLFFTPKDSTFMENLFIFSENDSTETDVVEPLSANATNETSDLSCSEDVKAEITSLKI